MSRRRSQRGQLGITAVGSALVLVLALLTGCASIERHLSTVTASSGTAPTTTTGGATASTAGWVFRQEPAAGYDWYQTQLEHATRFVDLWMYELTDPAVIDDLIAAHRRGVSVRVILDQDFTGGTVNTSAYRQLAAAGVSVRWAPADTIFHIKASIIDGDVLDVMTGNLTARYYATSMDGSLTLTATPASATIRAATATFDDDWAGNPPGDTSGVQAGNLLWSPGAQTTMTPLIGSARSSVWFSSEELTDRAVITALCDAARNGRTVHVLMTQGNLKTSVRQQLSRSGVQIVLTPDTSSATYVHQKTVILDGQTVLIGSQNATPTSLDDNRELGVLLNGSPLVGAITAGYQAVWNQYAD